MYDFPELQAHTDELCGALTLRMGMAAPVVRGPDLHAIWTDPNLLLGQTCGYPLVTSLAGQVTLLATPCYRAPGCDGPFYRSAIVVRATDPASSLSDLRGRRCAINDMASNSGMNLLRAAIAPLARTGERFFGETVLTGAHTASVDAVAQGRADVAAIDCVTWAHLQHLRPDATRTLRVLAWTQASPGLPLITSALTDASTRLALARALNDLTRDPALAPIRDALRLDSMAALPLSAYDSVLDLDRLTVAL